MTPATYHGVVQGGTVRLDGRSSLPDGTTVIVTPAADACASRGDPATLLAALKAAPPVPGEWVEELERLIEQGRRPPTHPNLFTDEPESP